MWLQGRTIPPVVQAVHENGLTYLGENALLDLYEQVRRVEDEHLEGRLIEAGCALGGSAIVIAAAKAKERHLYVYDVFDMIPPPTDQDGEDVHERYRIIARVESQGIRGATYYGYR
jgi:asparagine synthase (glutamine-hydrolysing)